MDSHPSALHHLGQLLGRALRAVLRPPPRMSVPEWADKFRHLSTSSGAVGGPWQTHRVEVARGPMMAVTEPGVRTISVMSCTQLLKTSFMENVIGYFAHLDPCPMLLTQPKDEAVEAFSKERLVPMVQATPVLRKLMGGDRRTRQSDDTLRFKKFPGGFLAMGSAGSPTNLAMRAIRVVLLDEVDKYEPTKEGDPVILAEERMATFATSSLSIRACSPTWEETSRIHRSYKEGDQRRPYVPCPHCGHWQTLDFFTHVHWDKDEAGEHKPETAAIFCEDCGTAWDEADRVRTITTKGNIQHRQTKPFTCCGEYQDPQETRSWEWDEKHQVGYATCHQCGERKVNNRHASFTASKLYSPFATVEELVAKWFASKDDPEQKQTYYNCLDVDTPIPTPNGFVRNGDLEAGDQIFDERGNVCCVTAASEVYTDRTCYEIEFADGERVVCDSGHLWAVKDYLEGERVTTAEDIAANTYLPQNRYRFAVQNTEPLVLPPAALPIEPYLLGVWLGDGASGAACAGYRDSMVRQEAGARGRDARRVWLKTEGEPLRKRPRLAGGNKHIPAQYLRASEAQRWALLNGLMDTDGSSQGSSARFTTTSAALEEGAVELLRSLGFKPVVTYSGKLRAVRFTAYRHQPIFRLSRKQGKLPEASDRASRRSVVAVRRAPTRPVKCVQVDSPNSLYLCGLGMIPTHNTQLGRPFKSETAREISHHWLMNRTEQWGEKLPPEVLVLTAGVDVQAGGQVNVGRLELELVGWGLGEESWSIDRQTFLGDPARPEVWASLDEYLLKPWEHAYGMNLHATAACIDSGGHNTQDVYAFCRRRIGRNVWAIKGANDRGQWSPVWPGQAREAKPRKYRVGFRPIILGVNAAKEIVRSRLFIEEPGPGYCHFPVGREEAWFDQLTSEDLVIETKGGATLRKWLLKKGKANEGLDCRVYAYAALQGLYHTRRLNLSELAAIVDLQLTQKNTPKPAPRKRGPRRGSWMEG